MNESCSIDGLRHHDLFIAARLFRTTTGWLQILKSGCLRALGYLPTTPGLDLSACRLYRSDQQASDSEPFSLASLYGPLEFDVKNHLATSFLYELQFGREKRFHDARLATYADTFTFAWENPV